eukprot:gene30871-38153_t
MAVAQAMGQFANKTSPKPSFVLALGDNFYANGVSSSTDVLWSYLWKNVYLTNYPALYIPWYPVFGNHDYGGSTDAQIQRYLDHTDDDIWMFESSYYLKTFAIPGGGSVAILFIDTTTLAPSENKCCNENGGISTDVQQQRISAQLSFINESLFSVSGVNRPTWLFVSGHYPVFSAGDKGDTEELLEYLLPLLERYGVDAYFTGHDHISEHLQYGAMHHFVAGAGSMTDKLGSSASSADMLWYGVGYSAFAVVEASSSEYTVQFINAYGTQVYSYTVENNRTASTFTFPPSASPSVNPTAAPRNATTTETTTGSDATSRSWSWSERVSAAFRHMSRVATSSSEDPLAVASGGLLIASMILMTVVLVFTRRRKMKLKRDKNRALKDHPSTSPSGEHHTHSFTVERATHSNNSPGRYQGTTIRGDIEEGRDGSLSTSPDSQARRSKAALSNLFAALSSSNGKARDGKGKGQSPHYNRLHGATSPHGRDNKPLAIRTEESDSSTSNSSDDDGDEERIKEKHDHKSRGVSTKDRAEEDVNEEETGATSTEESSGPNGKNKNSNRQVGGRHKRVLTSPN